MRDSANKIEQVTGNWPRRAFGHWTEGKQAEGRLPMV